MIELSELLRKLDLDPTKVRVMRHRPTEVDLRRALPWMAEEQHDLFNAYQSCHGARVENSLMRASHLVSCIGTDPGLALFVGIYEVAGWNEITSEEWQTLDSSKKLSELGDRGPEPGRQFQLFDLALTPKLAEWKGRLVLSWPPPERSWWRVAARNVFEVHAIHDTSVLVRDMPAWTDLVLSWTELQTLPKPWKTTLAQWRGIYLILDRETGKSYVGSAYGEQNILARWLEYAATGHGGNVELKGRDPTRFQFAVLERVSPDSPPEAVIQLEASWKTRLGTREFGLNRN